MKRLLIYIGIISFSLVLALATLGIVNYVDKENSLDNKTVSAEIFDLQTEVSNLYIDKQTYEEDQAEINAKIEALLEKESISAIEKTELLKRLNEVESSIASLEEEIENAIGSTEELYLKKQEFEEEKQSIEARLTQLELEDTEIKNEISSLSSKVTELENTIANINIQINEINNQIDELYSFCNNMGRNIITVTFDSYFVASGNIQNIFKLRVHDKVGNKLSLKSDGKGVVVGAGVSKVLISYAISSNASSTGERVGHICLNNSIIQMNFEQFDQGKTTTISGAPFLWSVAQGNVIDLRYHPYDASGDYVWGFDQGSLRTYMTIEVVEW